MTRIVAASLQESLQLSNDQFEIEPHRGRKIAITIVDVKLEAVREKIYDVSRIRSGVFKDPSPRYTGSLRFIGTPVEFIEFAELLHKNYY